MTRTSEQLAEAEKIKAQAESMQAAADRLEDLSRRLRVCLDPTNGSEGHIGTARQQLVQGCRELEKAIEVLAAHGTNYGGKSNHG